jgi:hypothetical protein
MAGAVLQLSEAGYQVETIIILILNLVPYQLVSVF